MSVSVIIVNYNAGDWLARCLDSVVPLAEVDHVFVVDNASRDISLDLIQPIIEQYPERLSLIENERNLGFAAANNQILQRFLRDFQSASDKTQTIRHQQTDSNKTAAEMRIAEGIIDSDFVLLLNPDCEINAEVLPAMLAQFAERPKLGMAGCTIRNEDGSIQSTCLRQFPTPKSALWRMLQLHRLGVSSVADFDLGKQPLPTEFVTTEAISGAFMLVRVEALREVGVLDEAYFMHCEDLDWCKRFELAAWHVGFVPTVSVLHAKGVSSKSRPIGVLWTLHKGMLRFFDKFYRQQYSAAFRLLVATGVYGSFVIRAAWAGLKAIAIQDRRQTSWNKRMR